MSVTIYGTSNVVLQVKSSTLTTTFFNGTNNSFVETGLTVTISPTSSSSKIYVLATIGIAAGYSCSVRLHRNGSALSGALGDAAGSRPQQSARSTWQDGNHPCCMVVSYLDSPGTTAATTYSIAGSGYGGYGFYMNRSGSDANVSDQYGGRGASTITAMELSA